MASAIVTSRRPLDDGMGKNINSSDTVKTICEEKCVVGNDLSSACEVLNTVYSLMEDSYEEMQKLRAYLEDERWMGQSKEAFLVLLELISEFHSQLKEAIKENNVAMDWLNDNIDEYLRTSSIISLLGEN